MFVLCFNDAFASCCLVEHLLGKMNPSSLLFAVHQKNDGHDFYNIDNGMMYTCILQGPILYDDTRVTWAGCASFLLYRGT